MTTKYVLGAFLLFFIFSCTNNKESESTNVQPLIDSRLATATGMPYFILFSDVHLNHLRAESAYGDDTGTELFDLLMKSIQDQLSADPAPSFVLFTGDLPAHLGSTANHCGHHEPSTDGGGLTDHRINDSIVLNQFLSYFESAGIPFLYLPGNNDALSGDYDPFAGAHGTTPLELMPNNSQSIPTLNVGMDSTKIPYFVDIKHIEKGYYAVDVIGDLRIIALNTVIYSTGYTSIATEETDRAEQMQWLSDQLALAKKDRKKVYLAMHIPPGMDAHEDAPMWDNTTTNWNHKFLSVIQEYQLEISNLFYSHTHMDEFRRLYDTIGVNITEIAYSSPGISPVHCNNPGYKVVYYNFSTYVVEDLITHYSKPTASIWIDSTYSWKDQFNVPAGSTLQQTLVSNQKDNLLPYAEKVYTVFNGEGSASVSVSIDVK